MLEQATREEWREVMDINLIGASQVTAAALPHLRACEGRAVYVSSYAVRQSLPGSACIASRRSRSTR
jgi:NAD(P)-dependent dehydrogenase (short-subunit alcohol dehydrogenase family)